MNSDTWPHHTVVIFAKVELGIDGGLGQTAEELEEPWNELGGQLLLAGPGCDSAQDGPVLCLVLLGIRQW